MNFINKYKKVLLSILVLVLFVSVGEYALASIPKVVELVVDGHSKEIETSSKNVEELLEEQGYNKDNIRLNDNELETKIKNNTVVNLDTKKSISFSNQGKTLNVNTFTNNVKDFLDENNVDYDEDDFVSPDLDNELSDKDEVVYNDIVVDKYVKKEDIKFETKKTYDFSKELGYSEVTKKGENGVKELHFEKVTVNGKVISDELKEEKVSKEPVTQEELLGSKKVVKQEIAFDTIRKNDSSIYKGNSKVVQSGKTGSKQSVYRVEGDKEVLESEKVLTEPTNKIVRIGTKSKPVSSTGSSSTRSASSRYSLGDLRFQGVIHWGGKKFTYYSQQVLPGGGLRIPGRHVNAGGFVADKDGYIVLANNAPKGTVIATPFGYMGKVYDRGTYGNHFDVYTR